MGHSSRSSVLVKTHAHAHACLLCDVFATTARMCFPKVHRLLDPCLRFAKPSMSVSEKLISFFFSMYVCVSVQVSKALWLCEVFDANGRAGTDRYV